MQTERLKLSQVSTNEANPRTITDGKFQKLITSLLVLPKMLSLRPIVVDERGVALGGNMRLRALAAIAAMSEEEVQARLAASNDYAAKTEPEQQALLSYWAEWRGEPWAEVVRADALTEAERREFVIKDNVGFGDWDMDALANEWDTAQLGEWGVDIYFLDPSSTVTPTPEPTDDNFEAPERTLLECPACHHRDEQAHFQKVKQ